MLTVKQLAFLSGGKAHILNDVVLTGLYYDSRSCRKNSAFFAFAGLHVSGEDFIRDAVSNGAAVIVSAHEHKELESSVSVITATDVRRLFALASNAFFGCPSRKMKTIGITGTDGKTSTAFFTYQLIKAMGFKAGLSTTAVIDAGDGLEANRLHNTTPEAFDMQALLARAASGGCQYFVLEASSHALSREYCRLEGTAFAAACYTKVSSEHLEFHKSLDSYYESKARLASMTEGPVFSYSDSRILPFIRQNGPVLLERPEIISRSRTGLKFRYEEREYSLPYFEDFVLDNAYEAAVLTSNILGIELKEVLPHLSELACPPGRLDCFSLYERTFVIDYAHTPDAFHQLFSAFRRQYPDSDFIALFGASGSRDRSKRRPMGQEAALWCRQIILTEDDPREESVKAICSEIAEGMDPAAYAIEEDRSKAVEKAIAMSGKGDVLFFLGLGPQDSIDCGTYRKKWNEREAVLSAAKRFADNENLPC